MAPIPVLNLAMSSFEERAKARRHDPKQWQIRKSSVHDQLDSDQEDTRTATERVYAIWRLTQELWHISGRHIPTYARHNMPGRLIRNYIRKSD